jgi:thiamine kinase-like enzyme
MKDIDLICKLNKDWRPDNIKIKKAGGQTNRNFIVQCKTKKFFIRLPWERADIVNREAEAKNILALVKCKKLSRILPKYHLYISGGKNILSLGKENFDLPDGTMMAEYIPGKLFTLSSLKKKKYQEKLAQMSYIFHTSGIHFINKYNVFHDEIEKYRLAGKKYPILKIINAKTVTILEKIEKEVQRRIRLLKKGVPAHNDFIFQNFLIGNNDKMYLLDFEYAGMNEKGGILYDFGFLFADNFFRNPPINKVLFEKFLEVADKVYKRHLDRNQIYCLAVAVPIMQVWWGLLRYFSVKTQKEKKYFKDYVFKRTKGIGFLFQNINKAPKK